jgi:hypothetical protein
MASITKLQQKLAQADRRIVDARARLALQFEIVRRLEADRQDVSEAKGLYREIEDGLEAMLVYREHIQRERSEAPGEEAG